jgi:hypothetical protein
MWCFSNHFEYLKGYCWWFNMQVLKFTRRFCLIISKTIRCMEKYIRDKMCFSVLSTIFVRNMFKSDKPSYLHDMHKEACKISVISCSVLITIGMCSHILLKLPNDKFHDSPFSGFFIFMHSDGWTDWQRI